MSKLPSEPPLASNILSSLTPLSQHTHHHLSIPLVAVWGWIADGNFRRYFLIFLVVSMGVALSVGVQPGLGMRGDGE